MRSSRVLCSLLSVFLCCLGVLSPAAAAGSVWTIEDLEADPRQELEDIKGGGPTADQPAVMSIYEFDDLASADQPMLFSMNSGVAVAAEEGETSEGTVLTIDDLVPLMSLPDSAAAICQVYHPAVGNDYYSVPEWTEYRSYPENGSPVSYIAGDNYTFYHFLTSNFSVPDSLNDGEVTGFYGVSYPPYNGAEPNRVFSVELDLSSFGEFSSFSLDGLINVVQGFYRNGSMKDYVRCNVALYVNGAHVRTFEVQTSNNRVDFGSFEYDASTPIESIRFDFVPKSYNVSSYYFGEQACNLSIAKNSTVQLTIDVAEGTFRQEVTNGIGNIFQGILELPGKIVSLLIDGIKSLFIPSEDDMTSLTGKYQTLLSERLGFIWQAYELVSNLFTGILDALENGGAYEFTFPGISFPFNDEELVILPETPVSLENELMDVIRPVLGTIVCFIAVVGFMNVASDMVMALISGVSYYNFIRGKGGGSG